MRIRALLCTAAVMTVLAPHAQAASKRTATYYLNIIGGCSGTWAISRASDGSAACAQLPRALVLSKGVDVPEPEFTMPKKEAQSAKIDASRPLTGTLYAVAPGPNPTSPDLVGLITVDYEIAINKVRIGMVEVSGVANPAKPLGLAFSLKLPASLNGKPLTAIRVTPTWVTCLSPCAPGVTGAAHSSFVLPLK